MEIKVDAINELFSEKKALVVVVIMLVVGGLLVVAPALFEEKQKTADNDSRELEVYARVLEEGLAKAVKMATGSDDVSVMVTLESTFENVFVSDAVINEAVTADKTDRQSEKQLVLVEASTQKKMPVVVKRIPPRVKGAVIVCDNGNVKEIKSMVTELAATALNISKTKIYVTGGK